jgi:hypothetical protein
MKVRGYTLPDDARQVDTRHLSGLPGDWEVWVHGADLSKAKPFESAHYTFFSGERADGHHVAWLQSAAQGLEVALLHVTLRAGGRLT